MANLFIDKGNIGAPPTLKKIPGASGDVDVATMRVFFARYGQNDDTGDIEQVGGFWREVELYGSKARACAELLRKGARVLVVGEERDFAAHDADGNEVQAFKIVAQDVALQLTRVKSIEFEPSAKRGEREAHAA